MKSKQIFVYIDPKIKEEALDVLEGLGINLSQSVNMYFRQIAYTQKIPFELTSPSGKDRKLKRNEKDSLNIHLDPKIKEDALVVLKAVGTNITQAVNMYFREIAYKKNLPFELALPSSKDDEGLS